MAVLGGGSAVVKMRSCTSRSHTSCDLWKVVPALLCRCSSMSVVTTSAMRVKLWTLPVLEEYPTPCAWPSIFRRIPAELGSRVSPVSFGERARSATPTWHELLCPHASPLRPGDLRIPLTTHMHCPNLPPYVSLQHALLLNATRTERTTKAVLVLHALQQQPAKVTASTECLHPCCMMRCLVLHMHDVGARADASAPQPLPRALTLTPARQPPPGPQPPQPQPPLSRCRTLRRTSRSAG